MNISEKNSKYIKINLDDIDKHIVFSFGDRNSLVLEQVKHLRTQLLRFKQNNNTNLIMISSPSVQDGKSVVALNLAISLTLGLKETVLLVDGNLRRPSISKMLKIDEKERGLADYLTKEIELSDLLIKTDISKLTILPAGNIPHNPSELLGTEKMFELLDEIKKRYTDRFVIIDTPPVLMATEAAILGPRVDGALIVVCIQKTTKDELESSVTLLKQTNILGLVLNRVNKTIEREYKYK